MIPDYYQILGISTDASIDAIKRAYREKALRFHPDRGGSHEQMLRINEAFEVLSDPSMRRQYDYARAHPEDDTAQQRAAAEGSQARKHAPDYPREWAAFERWLNSVAKDVKAAEYGNVSFLFGLKLPTAGRSVSGWVLIVAGAALGLLLYFSLFAKNVPRYEPVWHRGAFFLFGGAWLGILVHQFIGKAISAGPSAKPATPESARRIVGCPKCQQQLKLPDTQSKLKVTCSNL